MNRITNIKHLPRFQKFANLQTPRHGGLTAKTGSIIFTYMSQSKEVTTCQDDHLLTGSTHLTDLGMLPTVETYACLWCEESQGPGSYWINLSD